MELLETLQQPWAFRALLASSMVGLMCGVLGCFIVLRNMAMIGDALSHAILPGVVVAFMLVGYSTIGFFVGSVTAGLLTAFVITWIQQNVKTKNDAAIGIVFTAMFSLGVIGISSISRTGVHLDLKDFLFGNVLGVKNEDLYLTGGVMVYVLVSIVAFYRYLFVSTFQPVIAETMGISVNKMHYFLMLMLSFAVVASLGTVGVILVVAMLITPASTALLLTDRLKWVLFLAGIVGLLSAIIGLIVSILFDTTPGPAMAIVATVFYGLAALFAPKKGLVFKYFQKRESQRKVQLEDVLKWGLRMKTKGNLSLAGLQKHLDLSSRALKRHLNTLKGQGYLTYNASTIDFTEKGKGEAMRLVRAHRLWETYLVNEMGLSAEQIHEDAEKQEHLLTQELLDEVDAALGFPEQDPHGSPIPVRRGLPAFSLASLKIDQFAKIALKQSSDAIEAKLWELGLVPNAAFKVESRANGTIQILVDNKRIMVPEVLAKRVNVKEELRIEN